MRKSILLPGALPGAPFLPARPGRALAKFALARVPLARVPLAHILLARVLLACTLLAGLFTPCGPALAAKEAPKEAHMTTRLPEVIVTGTILPGDIRDIPANVQVIGQEEIRKSGAVSLTQVLERTTATQLLIQPGSWGQFSMRGMKSMQSVGSTFSDRVLILIDGNRSGTGNLNNIPLANIERIEILRGSGSVQYGGQAVGGVINVISKRGKGKAGGKISAQYGSHDTYNLHGGLSLGVADDKVGIAVAAQSGGNQAYKTGNGDTFKNTRWHGSGGGLSLAFRPVEEANIAGVFIASNVYDTGNPGYYGMVDWSGLTPLTPRNKVKNDYKYGALNFDYAWHNGFTLQAGLFGNQNEYEDINKAWNNNSVYDARIFGGRLVGGLPLPDLGALNLGSLALGAEYNRHQQKLSGSSVSEPDIDSDVFSLFAEHRLSAGQLHFQYGLRYDYYDYDIKGGGKTNSKARSNSFNQMTWGAGVKWQATDWLSLRGAVRAAYVPPTGAQLYGGYSGPWGDYKGNSDLDAEKSLTYEGGIDLDYKGLSASLGYFYTKYKNRIGMTPLPGYVTSWKNEAGQRLAGFEAMIRYRYDLDLGETTTLSFEPYANLEWFTARHGEHNVRIADIPRYTAVIGLGAGISIFWLDLNAQIVGDHRGFDSYDENYGTAEYGSFTIYNARLSVNPWEGLSIFAELRNIGDKYYGYRPEFPMPGRTWAAGVSYEF